MPATPRRHLDDDLSRAWAIVANASQPESDWQLEADLARSAVAFGVGALDAYLCDAFADTFARAMKLCRREGKALPAKYAKLSIPVGPMLRSYEARPNWGLRMAARTMMEKDNMLQLGRVKDLLNPALQPQQKLWVDLAPTYIAVDRKRLTGIRRNEFEELQGKPRQEASKKAAGALLRRMGEIVKRRHDIVHNCDRPKIAPQILKLGSAKNMLRDIGSFALILDDHLENHRIY